MIIVYHFRGFFNFLWVIFMKVIKNKKEIQAKIEKVNGAMAQEGMPLTKELKNMLYNCYMGRSTFDDERKKIIDRYRRIYGSNL